MIKNQAHICLVAVVLALSISNIVPAQSSGGSFTITQSQIAGGGGTAGNGSFGVNGTSGQMAAGTTMTNSPYQEYGGFWTDVVSPTATAGQISGQVSDSNGNSVAGVAVRLTGTQNRMTITDALGNYHFDSVETNGLYVVTPARANFSFAPAQRTLSQLGFHTDAAFTANQTSSNLNPLDTTEYFVRQQYVDFLHREPDEAGFNFWVNNIESCGADQSCREAKRIDTSAAFFLSIECQQTGYLVQRVYLAAYGNLANEPVPITLSDFNAEAPRISAGVVVNQDGWQRKLKQNQDAYLADFVQRARFAAAYPSAMSPAEFVDKLLTNAVVNGADADSTKAISEFGATATSGDSSARARALRDVADSSALTQKEFDSAFVLIEYFGYLQRDPNSGPDTNFNGYQFWLNKLDTFNSNYQGAEMVKAFMNSTEYRLRLGVS